MTSRLLPVSSLSVFKFTQDNWSGSYTIDSYYDGTKNPMLVEVKFTSVILDTYDELGPRWLVCVWGNDDTGMEIDCNTREQAWEMFIDVIQLDFVNQTTLKEMGFVYT